MPVVFLTATPFPQRAFPTLEGQEQISAEIALCTAMLLYFDSVKLNLFDPRPLFDRFDVAGAQRALTRLRNAKDDDFEAVAEELTLHEHLSLSSNAYFGRMEDFLQEWKVLFDEGILSATFWDQSEKYEEDGSFLNYGPIVKWWFDNEIESGFLERYGANSLAAIGDPLAGSLSEGGVAQLFHDYLKNSHPDELCTKDLATKELRLRQLHSLDAVFNMIFAHRYHTIASSVDAFRLLACVPERSSAQSRDVHNDALALLAQTIVALPLALPRSAAAIAEIRTQMRDELGELRERLREIVLAASPPLEGPTLERLATDKLINPVRSLRRRLARPNRQLARNLVSQAGVVSAVIGVATSMGRGADFWTNALVASIALGTAAIKTRFDQERAVEESGIAFLFKAVSE